MTECALLAHSPQFTLNPCGLILWLLFECVRHIRSNDSFNFMLKFVDVVGLFAATHS